MLKRVRWKAFFGGAIAVASLVVAVWIFQKQRCDTFELAFTTLENKANSDVIARAGLTSGLPKRIEGQRLIQALVRENEAYVQDVENMKIAREAIKRTTNALALGDKPATTLAETTKNWELGLVAAGFDLDDPLDAAHMVSESGVGRSMPTRSALGSAHDAREFKRRLLEWQRMANQRGATFFSKLRRELGADHPAAGPQLAARLALLLTRNEAEISAARAELGLIDERLRLQAAEREALLSSQPKLCAAVGVSLSASSGAPSP
ncbi:hypothetical protein PV762_26955 [Mitsuaria sp. CC2]|uniref:hypothetical protein n=1 Tax=Mitsuaria sp. CC2 TaxID=3029186 RepID=UPI003B8B9AF8